MNGQSVYISLIRTTSDLPSLLFKWKGRPGSKYAVRRVLEFRLISRAFNSAILQCQSFWKNAFGTPDAQLAIQNCKSNFIRSVEQQHCYKKQLLDTCKALIRDRDHEINLLVAERARLMFQQSALEGELTKLAKQINMI